MADIILPVHLGHSQDKDEYQGAEAIARAIGVHRNTILRWKRAGAPIVLIGKKYQCRYDELWEWIRKNEKNLYSEAEEEKQGKKQNPVN